MAGSMVRALTCISGARQRIATSLSRRSPAFRSAASDGAVVLTGAKPQRAARPPGLADSGARS